MTKKSSIFPILFTLGVAPLAGCDAPSESDDCSVAGSGATDGGLESTGGTSEAPSITDGGSGSNGGPVDDVFLDECPEAEPPYAGFSPHTVAFLQRIDRISTVTGNGVGGAFAQAELFDDDDDLVGSFTVRMSGDDIEVLASFEDGDVQVAVPVDLDGACMPAEITFAGELDAKTAAERAAVLQLVAPGTVQPGFLGCLATLAISVGACSPPSVATGVGTVACGGATLAAACTCFEKEIEEKYGDVC